MTRLDILQHKPEIQQWISENKTKAYISKQLNCKPETLNNYLKKMNIEYAGQPGVHNLEQKNLSYIPAIEYSKKDYVSSYKLKEKLLKDKIKEYKCEICGLNEWNNQPIPLELHHIDGNHYNNNLANLQILCPNCHAQQSNIINKQNKIQYYCSECGQIVSKKNCKCKSCATIIKNEKISKRPPKR